MLFLPCFANTRIFARRLHNSLREVFEYEVLHIIAWLPITAVAMRSNLLFAPRRFEISANVHYPIVEVRKSMRTQPLSLSTAQVIIAFV